METDKSVQNQKSFVQLKDVLTLQKEYLLAKERFQAVNTTQPLTREAWENRARMQTFERVIRILSLPIEVS